MSKSILYAKWFHSETAAYRWVEARVWPDGPVCPHCGGTSSISKMNGRSTRIGAYKCYQCRNPFTVKIGTILEDSHLPLNLWLQAICLLRRPKVGSVQLVRTLSITPKTAKYILGRLRVADRQNGSADIEAKSNGGRRHGQRACFISTAREYGADGSVGDENGPARARGRQCRPTKAAGAFGFGRGSGEILLRFEGLLAMKGSTRPVRMS
jgi:transposase-like protein